MCLVICVSYLTYSLGFTVPHIAAGDVEGELMAADSDVDDDDVEIIACSEGKSYRLLLWRHELTHRTFVVVFRSNRQCKP
jgi:hypothetical protein